MIKADINKLSEILEDAKQKGCSKVKLQLYDNWEAVEKEQKTPKHALEEYQIDTRFYNTIEFETEVKDHQATDKIISHIEKDTLIIKVAISDRDSLLRGLGVAEFYEE